MKIGFVLKNIYIVHKAMRSIIIISIISYLALFIYLHLISAKKIMLPEYVKLNMLIKYAS